jgi:hypothetical protein
VPEKHAILILELLQLCQILCFILQPGKASLLHSRPPFAAQVFLLPFIVLDQLNVKTSKATATLAFDSFP